MKTNQLIKSGALLLAMLCLLACFALPVAAESARVYDPDGLLKDTEAAALATRLEELSDEYGVELYLATYVANDRYDDFYGDDYCTRVNNIKGTNAVLLVVTYERLNHTFYYNMYTYGEANYAVDQKEVNYILDEYDVYTNLKGGRIYDGACAFFQLTAEAYGGRVGTPMGVIIVISAVISLLIAFVVRTGIVASYKKKKASVDYPLDRYAKLELTRESDSFVREYVTRTYSPRSSSGGGGSGGRHGGGGGHRGGR